MLETKSHIKVDINLINLVGRLGGITSQTFTEKRASLAK